MLEGDFKRELTENEAERVSERRLTPDQAPRVDGFGGAVDVPASYPGRRHREYPYEEADRTAGKHHLLLRVVASFLLPCRPYSDSQDENVEKDDWHDTGEVDHLRWVRVHLRELELAETQVRQVWRSIRFWEIRIPAITIMYRSSLKIIYLHFEREGKRYWLQDLLLGIFILRLIHKGCNWLVERIVQLLLVRSRVNNVIYRYLNFLYY